MDENCLNPIEANDTKTILRDNILNRQNLNI